MKGLISWWARNSVAANLMMVAIILMGIVGFYKLEREFFPSVDVNGISVSAAWLGASPRDIEDQIITRIEDSITGLDGIDYIESSAREGIGSVNITTKVRADYDKLLDEVKVRIDGINNLPPDAYAPVVRRIEGQVDYMYLALHGDMDRLPLQRMAYDIRDEMARLPGGELVQDISKLEEEVTIEISEDALRKYDLTFNQVAQAISANSVNLSAGNVKTSVGDLQLKARNLANSAEDFGNIVIRQTAGGGKVYLRDIATIIDRFEDIDFDATFKGEEAIMFRVLTPETSNVTAAGENFREYIKEKNKELPEGIKLTMWFDGSTMFDARMDLIGSNALYGMILVLIILVLFLRPKVAMWVTAGILVSFCGAIAVLPMLGVSFNMISTFAILLVIGIVVDDAIVVGESIHFHSEHGLSGEKAAISGTNMVVKPVFFAVITTIMTFMPWMLLSGPMVAITRQITLVVIAALVFSLIEAFFILPAHLAHLKPIDKTKKLNWFSRFQNKMADGLVSFAKNTFRPVVAFLIKWRYATFATFVAMMLVAHFGIVKNGLTKIEMIPNPEGDMIAATINFQQGTNFERLVDVKDRLDEAINTVNANAKADFNYDSDLITTPGSFAGGNRVEAYLGLAPAETRRNISSNDIATKLEEYLGPVPDAYRIRLTADQGVNPNRGGVSYGITSSDNAALERAKNDMIDHLERYGEVDRTWDTFESSAQEMRFTLKPGAEQYGVTLVDVTRQVRQAFYGLEVQRLPRNGEDVRVVLRYPEAARDSVDSLEQLRIRTAQGIEVPLFSVAEISFSPGVSRISRRDRKRNIYVGARISDGPEAIQRVRTDMDEDFFPEWEATHPNVERLIIDADDMERTMMSELLLYGGMVLFMMYGLLAIAFRSYAQPLLIMIAIPFAYVGMVVGSWVTGVPMGMMSAFGFFAAAGVAVNDNLVLIDYVNRLRGKGVGAYQSVIDACVSRFRPILLTSVTTFVGILPMFAETSVQAEFLKPMVVALAFGVLFDFFLTLMLVPAMYGMGVDIKRFFKSQWTGVKQPAFGSTYNPEMAVALEEFEIEDYIPDHIGEKSLPAE